MRIRQKTKGREKTGGLAKPETAFTAYNRGTPKFGVKRRKRKLRRPIRESERERTKRGGMRFFRANQWRGRENRLERVRLNWD